MSNSIKELKTKRSSPWFESWFESSYYRNLYTARDEREASLFLDELINKLKPESGSSILDVGCGNGRHSKYLASKGFLVTGIDLAERELKIARQYQSPTLQFSRSDMREPFGIDQYNFIFNFFTSFGYFEDFEDNDRVIENMSRALKPNGVLVLDYLNDQVALNNLVQAEEKHVHGIKYSITRWTDKRFIYKKIQIEDPRNQETLEYTEQIARLDLSDFYEMMMNSGLKILNAYGDYQLSSFFPDRSPRLIIVAAKIF